MAKGFTKPPVGAKMRVTSDWSTHLKHTPRWLPRIVVDEGEILPPEDWDDAHTLRISTGNPDFPAAAIPLRLVVDMVDLDTMATVPKQEVKETPVLIEVSIPGSKGEIYVVTRDSRGIWACTCKGFGFRRSCRHVKEVAETV